MTAQEQTEQAARPAVDGSCDIELENVSLRFAAGSGESGVIYRNFSLYVERGSFTVILGPSGCGKSTLLNIVDGLLEPTDADGVRLLGKDIRHVANQTRHAAYVFQSPRLLPWKTLRGNVEFGLRGLRSQSKDRWGELIDRYFGIVGLSEYQGHYPHQVSGGMQQRAAIVRAWVNEPRVLLMDEPFSHLDEITAANLRRELVTLWANEDDRRTVMFVTHDIKEAVQLGTRIVILTQHPATIAHDERIQLPLPRAEDDEAAFAIEKRLRQSFARTALGLGVPEAVKS